MAIFIELFLLGVGLSMDAFAVSICKGLKMKVVDLKQCLMIAWFFGIFQAIMPTIGYVLSSKFVEYINAYSHWVAFVLLAYLGARMIYEGFKKEEEQKFNPLNYKVIFTLAVATSIDAMAVGVSLAFMGLNTWEAIVKPSVLIALISSLLTICGLALGIAAGKKIPFNLSPVGGLILISIGIKILIEHLS